MKELMNIITPFSRIPDRYMDMYFRGNKILWDSDGKIFLSKGGSLKTDTYYNSFSVKKWSKYTEIKDLFLHLCVSGKCKVTVLNHFRLEYGIAERVLEQIEINSSEENIVDIELTKHLGCEDMISFEIKAIDETTIYNASYQSNVEAREVCLALGVCTFKREDYVYRLIEDFARSNVFNVKLFISDNAGTLQQPNNDNIYLFKNKNYGGAGGFARCMLEVKRFNTVATAPITHLVLMDDDILFDVRVLAKLISFLGVQKKIYDNYFVCGAMCSLDEPNIQYERNSRFMGGNCFQQFGAGYDLMRQDICIINEEDLDMTRFYHVTAGWWFCCMSVNVFNENNYPFPCFFRGDDVEFALRNGSKVITLNGLNVWHEPFYKKYSNSAENYYLPRNLMVVNLLYRENAVEETINYFKGRFLDGILKYDYEALELLIRAMEDFFEGPDFFVSTDAEKLNFEVMKKNHKMATYDTSLGEYEYGNICWQANQKNDKDRIHMWIRRLSFNGYLLPKFMYDPLHVAGVGFRGRPYSFYKAQKVFNADTFIYKGYYTEIDKKRAWNLYKKFRTDIRYYKKNYKKLRDEYTLRFPYFQTEKFWTNYLGITPVKQ